MMNWGTWNIEREKNGTKYTVNLKTGQEKVWVIASMTSETLKQLSQLNYCRLSYQAKYITQSLSRHSMVINYYIDSY